MAVEAIAANYADVFNGPIMQELGVGEGVPEFFEIHNTISGEQATSTTG